MKKTSALLNYSVNNPVEFIRRRKVAMPDIQQLEGQKNKALAAQLKEIGNELTSAGLKDSGRAVRVAALALEYGEFNIEEVKTELDNALASLGRHLGAPKAEGTYWVHGLDDKETYNFNGGGMVPNPMFKTPQPMKDLSKKLFKIRQEVSTQTKSPVTKLYKKGTASHGILAACAGAGSRYKELEAFFPGLKGSSTLTHMRRQGVIQKSGEGQQTPYILTEMGEELLKERGPYTIDMYKHYTGTRADATKLKVVPWELSSKDRQAFVQNYCQTEGDRYC